ncbi:hypothetical protein F5Y04DRAFT_250833 [Hypomontagnella monticulosa]|nr:hypothetical protein F5Y04DRAFT_250833 [Hypomontagnella monticulosa]
MIFQHQIITAATLLVASFVNAPIVAGHGEFAAFPDAALFSPPDFTYKPGYGPRYYGEGTPPVPALLPDKARRDQTPNQCAQGFHSCLEVGPVGASLCCSNDKYCFLNSTWQPECCGLGITCTSTCPENDVSCNATITSIVSVATSTAIASTSLKSTCCGRPCSSSSFLCQEAFGGQCCEYGAVCHSGGSCSFPPTSSVSPLVPIIPSGCTTSQYACPTGPGCCNNGQICTSSTVSGTFVTDLCAPNLTVVENSTGLAEGARIGIGVGVAVGAAIIIGAVTWFWIHRRREAKSRETLAGSGEDYEDQRRQFVPSTFGDSDTVGPIGTRPRPHEDGLTRSYDGPDAIVGPYTDRPDSSIGMALSTEPRTSPGFSDHSARAVGLHPNEPGDIVQPVELHASQEGMQRVELGEKASVSSKEDPPVREEIPGPFELPTDEPRKGGAA